MNIDNIRSSLLSYVGVSKNFAYYGSRGQNEKFSGKIVSLYPRVFTVMCDNGTIKSFSYSDFAIKHLKIYWKKEKCWFFNNSIIKLIYKVETL